MLFTRTKRALDLALAVSALAGWLCLPANAQLLHRYDFESAGNANDTVGTAHGTVYGSATVSGGALNTSGAVGGLSGGVPRNCAGLPASAVAGITNAFSIEVWFAVGYNGGYCTLFSFSANNTANYVLATPATGTSPFPSRVEVVGGGGSGTYQRAHQIYTDNASLRQMVVTYDGTNVTYYLDGTLSTYSNLPNTFTDIGLNLSALTYIGIAGGAPYGDNTINGKVFDFRIYGKALTPMQVAAVYGLGANPNNAVIAAALASPDIYTAPVASSLQMPVYGNYWAHDPSKMIKDGTRYYVFTTGKGIPNKYSTDLRNWTAGALVAPAGPPAWASNAVPGHDPNNWAWAPDVAYFNGRYHLYYSISEWATIDSAIGLYTSPSLTSATWTDQGKVVQSDAAGHTQQETDTTSFNCIDPSILVDTNGTVWMAFGSYSSGILVTQLDPLTGKRLNTNSLVATLVANNSGGGWGSSIEGAFIYQRGGYYYLFVNYGGCCSGIDSTYNIRVGRSTSVTGPYLDKNGVNMVNSGGTMFLESTGRFIGPGHPGIMDDNGTNWFTFHYYDGNDSGTAKLGVATMSWTVDGWPALANDWSALYTFNTDAREHLGLFNGTLVNGASIVNEPGRGNVLNLDGVTNHVSLPVSVGNCSTIAAWVKWNGGAAWQRIFDFGAGTGTYFYLTPKTGSGKLRFAITTSGPGGEQGMEAPSALPTNSWVHVAVSLDGAKGILYLNGAPVATNNSLTIRPWQTLARNLYIGKSQWPDPPFSGRIDSFRVFGRALSASEIKDLFLAPPDLAHRYSFVRSPWDSVGMAHGALMGNATVTNYALKLTGATGGYVNLPGGLVSGSSVVTLEFWATFGVNGNWARVVDFGNYTGNFGSQYFFFSPHSGLNGQRVEMTAGSAAQATTWDTSGTFDNRALHVVCVMDPGNNYAAIYTNGILESARNGSWPAFGSVSTAWSFIGRSLFSGNGDAYLNATIDEFRIYDGRLTPEQIAFNYQSGPGALALPVTLSATNSAGAFSLSWPSWAAGYALQSSTNLVNWSASALNPVLVNDHWRLTLSATNTAQFFRLRQ